MTSKYFSAFINSSIKLEKGKVVSFIPKKAVEFDPGQFFLISFPKNLRGFSFPWRVKKSIVFYLNSEALNDNYELPKYAGLIGPLGKGFPKPLGKRIGVLVEDAYIMAALALRDVIKGKVAYFTGNEDLGLMLQLLKEGDNNTVSPLEEFKFSEFSSIYIIGSIDFIKPFLKRYGAKENITIASLSKVSCGLGFCGSCILGKTGKRLCVDGPGFRLSEIKEWVKEVVHES
ncbi:MAG: hypothetical protein F7B61_00625 [Caldisphaeraceae archaeon]|nr:hypothetical protein [Caldisphaeraceae archaeon]